MKPNSEIARGLFQYTPTGYIISDALGRIATAYTYSLLMWLSGTIVAIFVPSSGGQWIIQGLITVLTAERVRVSYQRGLLSLGVGDQQGNLWAPFWYIVASSTVRMDFRKFFGYGLLGGVFWAMLGILCYTFLPLLRVCAKLHHFLAYENARRFSSARDLHVLAELVVATLLTPRRLP